ncbi:MAG: polysaccharide lyase 6 family protein [Rikenellaceae bacterium]
MKRRFLLALAVALASVLGANAKVIRIAEAEQAKECFMLNGGDTLVLAEGIWDNLNIRFKSVDGKRGYPVVFRGETAGKTILRGLSSLSFSGYGIVVEDLWFEDPITDEPNGAVIQFRTSATVNANESVIRNVRMTGFNTDFHLDDQSQWLAVYGMRNVVENCSFEDKVWLGCTVAVFTEPWMPSQSNHIIRNNYFTRPRAYFNEKGSKINSQETFRIGMSTVSMSDARCLVENNVFERCSAELEFISNKSCNNTYRGNVFLECEGIFTIRHGNGNIIEDNYFDGRNVPGTGGIRLVGEDQIVRNNYMQDLAGDMTTPAIRTVMGIQDPVINSYFQVKNSIIEGNVAINTNIGMVINSGTGAKQDLPFSESIVKDNVFVSNKIAVHISNPAPVKVIWKDNTFDGGEFVECSPENLGSVTAKAQPERRAMPVFDFGPDWKHLYE